MIGLNGVSLSPQHNYRNFSTPPPGIFPIHGSRDVLNFITYGNVINPIRGQSILSKAKRNIKDMITLYGPTCALSRGYWAIHDKHTFLEISAPREPTLGPLTFDTVRLALEGLTEFFPQVDPDDQKRHYYETGFDIDVETDRGKVGTLGKGFWMKIDAVEGDAYT